MLFVHGWGVNQRYWKHQIEPFSKQFRVITLDLPGHGASSKEGMNWTVDRLADDIVDLIKKLELEKLILVGHSMGGDIILDIALQIPNKVIGFVGVDTFKEVEFVFTPEIQQEMAGYIQALQEDFPSSIRSMVYEYLMLGGHDSLITKQVYEDISQMEPQIAIEIFKKLTPKYEETSQLLEKLHVPLRLINNTFFPTDTLAIREHTKWPYQIIYIDSVGHYPMVERPQTFNEALFKHVNSIMAN